MLSACLACRNISVVSSCSFFYVFINICFGFNRTKLKKGKFYGGLWQVLKYDFTIFLKDTYERVYQEEFLNKTDAFPERLEQLAVSKKNIWGSCYRLLGSFVWSYNTSLSSQINLKIQVTASGDQICFFSIVNVKKKITIRILR